MKLHNFRPWLPLIAAVAAVAIGVVAHKLRPRASDSEPPTAIHRPDVPAGIQVRYLGMVLTEAKDLHVLRPGADGYCYIVEGSEDMPTLADVWPSEEYADCWRGVVLCEPNRPGLPDGPHAIRAGDLYLFGDELLLERVKPAAAMLSIELCPEK